MFLEVELSVSRGMNSDNCWMIRSGEKFLVDFESLAVEADELHHLDAACFDMLTDSVDGDASGAFRRKRVDTGADGGKCDGADLMLLGEFEATAVATRQELVFFVVASMPDGANSVEDPFGRKLEARSGLGIPCGAAVKFAARGEKLWASRIVDGAIDTSAAEQRGVGSIHDCVDLLFGDVALHCDEFGHLESPALTIYDGGWMAAGCNACRKNCTNGAQRKEPLPAGISNPAGFLARF